MKTLSLFAASALALGVAGCGPKTPPARAALDCPPKQGDLTRTAASPDGKACTYVTSNGAEVKLQLVSTAAGGPDAALSAIEARLLADRAPPAPEATAKDAGAKGEHAAAAVPGPTTGDAARRATREAAEDTRSVGVQVSVGKDGATQVVTDDGETTHVNLPGVHIIANGRDDSANVKIGPLTVKAGEDGVDVRMRRDVRLRGEALNPNKRGIRATFIYTGKDLPDGLRFVGYEAGGPKTGPITVATVRSKQEQSDGGDAYPDVKRLVRRNGGV